MLSAVELGEIRMNSVAGIGPTFDPDLAIGTPAFRGTQIFFRSVESSNVGGWKRIVWRRVVPRYFVFCDSQRVRNVLPTSNTASTWCQESSGLRAKMSL